MDELLLLHEFLDRVAFGGPDEQWLARNRGSLAGAVERSWPAGKVDHDARAGISTS